MKTIVKLLPALLTALFALGSCAEKEIEYNMGGVDAVEELIAPAGVEATLLNPELNRSFTFKWKTVASGAVRYSVAFSATAAGEELLRITPADGAVNGSTTIPYTTVDQIAYRAGIKAGEEGDLYWTVYTIRGNTEVKASAAPKKLPVERLAGLESPVHLFITGAATEGGTDITAAIPFRNDSDNVFVVYTELEAGQPFIFTNDNFGTGYESYSYSIEDRKYIEGGNGAAITPMTVETGGVYRVTANIRFNRFTIELIENLRLFYPAGIEVEGETVHDFPMTYLGGGVWKLEGFRFEFTDSRYAFHAEVSGKPRVWGHNDAEVATPPAVTGGAYYYVYDFAVGADYDHAYRLMGALTGMTTDIYVDMSAAAPAPTHTFDLARFDEVPPVVEFTAPADDASLDLNDTANFNVTFSWTEPTYDKAFPAKYEVVFFEDAAGETEITSVPALDYGLDTETTVARNILDNAASVVGADIGAQGTIWWSVRTSMLDESVMATPAPRKLNVTRITLPDQLYISGAATEQADVANALKMRKLEDGVFQGYYTFRNNAAGFRLTDGTTGEYATYAYVDGIFTPSASTATIPASVVAGVSNTDRQYRITVDFKTNTITTQIIRTVTIHIQGRGRNNTMNTYQGNGAWSRSNWSVGTGGDTRYYFRVSYSTTNPSTNGNAWAEKWGCSRVDTNPDPTTTNLDTYGGQAYYNVVEYIGSANFRAPGAPTNENDWHYAWKLVTGSGLSNTGSKTFTVYMNGGTGTGATTGTITSDLPFHTY